MEKNNVLVVDDDKEIVDAIDIYLRNEGFNVIKAYDGLEALEALMENDVYLILMDIMMPNMDGLRTTMKIRKEKNIPIILISAKSEDTDKILGLNMGADDYITKPFNPLELIARVKSQLRRYTVFGNYGGKKEEESNSIISSGGLSLNQDTKEVLVDGESIKLTATEFGILELLLRNQGRVFSIDEIYENGNFKAIEDITKVSGIGQALYEKIKDYITV